ncbi:AraC family transcriptional regulator ligand-binding domain-containing protein [Tropicimonas sp. TH_r6]|uniref:AraC family transcriptional regulator n=1 Tax=Tropicimonas sp. TH_r6 TaxID=3082085 RepID=UPI0029539E41|nr:AraC family transcriptional regulator ligand-binding domain-containing protein [Tropicimonas sp. TH_r6]MDV7145984.1 AraC family transcriptional regulator ligand-binding domain-containing protein [Tropicimonas sp. TH_r6]
MRKRERYLVADATRAAAQILGVSPERVLRRAGLPEDHLAAETRGVTAREWFALWEAMEAEYVGEDIATRLGQAFARGPFVPPIFAFSCSPNIEMGLTRLALFKPLIGPIRLDVTRQEDAVIVTYTSVDPEVPMPAACARFEAAYFVECCRIFTGEQIVPLEIGMIGEPEAWAPLSPMLEVEPTPAENFHLTFSLQDATLPLITQNEELWAGFEESLRKKMLNRNVSVEITERVRNALLEALPSGHSTVDDVCKRLHLSKRTLQRKLKDEGRTFQEVLDETRSDLSHHYLKQPGLSVVEISYLVGFQDPGSFYRAFQGWTGQTPADVRNQFLN